MIRERSRAWPYKRQFIEGAYKIMLFSRHLSPAYCSVLSFIQECGLDVRTYFDFDHNAHEVRAVRAAEMIVRNDVEVQVDPIQSSCGLLISMIRRLNLAEKLLPFDALLQRRIFLAERVEKLDRTLRSHQLLQENENVPLEAGAIPLPSDPAVRRELATLLYKDLIEEPYLWHDVYENIIREFRTMDLLRARQFQSNTSHEDNPLIRMLVADEEEVEGFADLADYLRSLMTVKYILECTCIKEAIEAQVKKKHVPETREMAVQADPETYAQDMLEVEAAEKAKLSQNSTAALSATSTAAATHDTRYDDEDNEDYNEDDAHYGTARGNESRTDTGNP